MASPLRLFLALLGLTLLLVAQSADPTIKTGDTLEITGNCCEDIRPVTVKSDGKVILPLLGDVKAEGLTLSEFSRKLEEAFAKYIRHPKVTVRIGQKAR